MSVSSQQCTAQSVGPVNQLMTSLVSTLLAIHCNISSPNMWPEDYGPTALKIGLQKYDFVVIGAGSAGSVVASRLSENPHHTVLLLEAGGDPSTESEIPEMANDNQNTRLDWAYSTKSNGISCLGWIDESCPCPKGKVLGGSSSINGMLYVRGNSRDYDNWKNQGNPTWDWKTVLSYFEKSENFNGPDIYNAHGNGGLLNVESFQSTKYEQLVLLNAAKELRYKQVKDFVNGNNVGYGFLYGTVKDGRRYSTAKAFLTIQRKNLHIIKHACATKIHFDTNKKVESVSFVYNDRNQLKVDLKKELILSAGVIETPKLLMLSGIGPKTSLLEHKIPVFNDLPVGENLQDHAVVPLILKFDKNITENKNEALLDAVYEQWIHRDGPLGIGVLDVGAFINTNDRNGKYPDIQYIYLPIRNRASFANNFKSLIRKSILELDSNYLIVAYVTMMNPKSRGTVQLKSRDYRDKPLIYPNTFDKDYDKETVIRGIKQHFNFELTKAFKNLNGKIVKLDIPECDRNFEYKTNDYWKCYIKYMTATIYHHVGTVKMGPNSDPTAVVDSELRVKGVEGLRVVDASIMPTIVSGNTNAPTIMIGEKGADFVKNTWK